MTLKYLWSQLFVKIYLFSYKYMYIVCGYELLEKWLHFNPSLPFAATKNLPHFSLSNMTGMQSMYVYHYDSL